ncbi:uncharacterized protein LOC143288506 [Babylonia areolata]|uniref:uncharacterized protein LOC143288506 n=1 Tax=Babylonia areolata TaxID=304850 RepID=UPI003FD18B42
MADCKGDSEEDVPLIQLQRDSEEDVPLIQLQRDYEEDVPLIKLQTNPNKIGRSCPEHATGLQKPESQNDNNSDDDIPLVVLQKKCRDPEKTINILNRKSNEISKDDNQTQSIFKTPENCNDGIEGAEEVMSEASSSEGMSLVECYDSDKDPEFNPGQCEVKRCKKEVWAACPDCEILVCFDHFNEEISSCSQHGAVKRKKRDKGKTCEVDKLAIGESEKDKQADTETTVSSGAPCDMQTNENDFMPKDDVHHNMALPEDYNVEGSAREVAKKKMPRPNKQKEAKRQRSMGQEYTSNATKKKIAARKMKTRCKEKTCVRQCSTISDEQRHELFQSYYALADLRLQREFLVRHIKCSQTKRKSKPEKPSRRQITKSYFFTINQNVVPVCKVFFLNTLALSEQTTRTALSKITSTGTLTKDNRGGRQSETVVARDQMMRRKIEGHIDRFPRVESHFCRESTTRDYLHPDLTKRKMYNLFLKEWNPQPNPPSFALYKKIFKEKNLSIHRPKKDQCSLCMTYLKGDETVKENLRERYEIHVGEKQKVRDLKDQCKKEAVQDEAVLCASFDLQQVIYLPISKEGALFYKRRLAVYNLTFYNIGDKNCHCFTWDEATSKRGSCEISTGVFEALKFYDVKGVRKAYLFSDGCAGQNKNSIMPAMMLYTVSKSTNLQEISLRFFESYHGQNEGDSAHSAINQAVSSAGDLFQPSQLTTVFSLARPKQPYIIHQLQFDDFLDFKTLSKDLRILEARRSSGSEDSFNWNRVMELKVSKQHLDKVFYKTSHCDQEFKSLSLKRLQKDINKCDLRKLNAEANKISKEKHNDLLSLCLGTTPVVNIREHKSFYMNLPHFA